MIIPAAIRNPLVDIPKKLKQELPAKCKCNQYNKRNDCSSFHNMLSLLFFHPFVIVKKTGIVPKGLVNVKRK